MSIGERRTAKNWVISHNSGKYFSDQLCWAISSFHEDCTVCMDLFLSYKRAQRKSNNLTACQK